MDLGPSGSEVHPNGPNWTYLEPALDIFRLIRDQNPPKVRRNESPWRILLQSLQQTLLQNILVESVKLKGKVTDRWRKCLEISHWIVLSLSCATGTLYSHYIVVSLYSAITINSAVHHGLQSPTITLTITLRVSLTLNVRCWHLEFELRLWLWSGLRWTLIKLNGWYLIVAHGYIFNLISELI